ncbi:MAG TPA: hypothetical protein PKE26_11850 [Kiritimatiellia bacterium]|nr:hypothetical protein [Kiritimatiellia bacterium]HMO99794.1 hypothetical protein [Kiritimatiellia bacterium]HMP97227.1 hypothetical protein [Kiritimatiellia bacterium]
MLATKTIQDKILERLKATYRYRSCEAYPLSRLNTKTFPDDLARLNLPAALLVFVEDDFKGRPWERKASWILILIAKGSSQDAATFILEAIDEAREKLVSQVVEDKCFLLPDSQATALESTESYTAAALNLSTVERQ